jgi:type IV secretion system protein VirB10
MLIRPEARAPRAAQADVTVPAGTRIALALRNEVDTKHSREGDRIYLETIYPVAAGGRIVVPAGSFVNGTVTISRPAGKAKGKGELFIRFDSLTLPNGATREFRSRLGSAEGKTVDREEGKVSGERDTGHDVGRVATTTGVGASIGGIAGAASGHAIQGVGIGAAIGAAVGLASILGKRGPEATLRRGTTLEMILDRDISFTPAELRWY